jgi:phospholipid/cholesterol/gamma-HCH transport system substrate-binding protein
MDLSYRQEVTIGGLVILAIALFIGLTTWLGGRSIFSNSDEWYTIRFKDAGNLKPSSVVRVSGVAAGKVEDIKLKVKDTVLVRVNLEDWVAPRQDATAELVAVGFVGDVAINLDPGTSADALTPEETRDTPIPGHQARGLTDLAETLGKRADTLLVGAQAIVNQKTADRLYAMMDALQGTLKAAQRTMEVYGNPNQGPTAQLTQTMATLERIAIRLDSALADPALTRTLQRADTLTGNLADMTAQLTSTSARLDTLLLRINQGQGTIGKFATDSGFYTDIRELSQSMKEVLDELKKHPGKVPVTVRIF